MSKLLYALLVILFFTPAIATGAGIDKRFGVGIESGLVKLGGGEKDYSNIDQSIELRLTKGLSRKWTLGAGLFYGVNRPGVGTPGEDAGMTFDTGAAAYTTTKIFSIDAAWRPFGDHVFTPWISCGAGFVSWQVFEKHGESDVGFFPSGDAAMGYDEDGQPVELSGSGPTASFGLGTEIFLNRNLALNVGGRLRLIPTDDIDNVGLSAPAFFGDRAVDANTMMLEAFVGFSWFFGSIDRDDDGIEDYVDVCPDSPEDIDGFEDEDGCPDLDNDGDHVLDIDDACPDTPEDRDGFEDDDGCPEADNDGDGIPDTSDECPDTPEDMDGFRDRDGCPDFDNDRDGVPDDDDACPDTPAGTAVNEDGCALTAEIPDEVVLEGISFRTSSAVLTPESLVAIRRTKEVLVAWPEVLVEIRGHTDSIGLSEANRSLSLRRANAVREALIGLGVNPLQITAVGYGEDYPIADNGTATGRALNRRVELHRLDR